MQSNTKEMEEIEYKLNSKNNVFIVNAMDKLVTHIYMKILKLLPSADRRKLLHGPQPIEAEVEEIKLLWAKCSTKDIRVSQAACHGLLILVELHALEVAQTMSTLVGILPSAHNYSAIISTMAGLLILDMKQRVGAGFQYENRFRLKSPQHPFITVLETNEKTEYDILTQMQALCTHPEEVVSTNCVELLWPVFLWLTSHPQRECNIKPWQLLLSLPDGTPKSSLLVACLSSQQMRNPDALQHSSAVYCAVIEAAISRQPRSSDFRVLLVMLARISTELVKHKRDPRPCYSMLHRCFNLNDSRVKPVVGITILLLAENLTESSALHLPDLFTLCLSIIKQFEYPGISLSAFVALTFQWFLMPAYLTGAATTAASKILGVYQNRYADDQTLNTQRAVSNTIFESLLHTDSHLSVVFKLLQNWERLRHNPAKLGSWLDIISATHDTVKHELLPFLLGIVLEKKTSEETVLKALKIVVNLASVDSQVCVQLLPVLLYKIGRDVRPTVKLECVKALPLMASVTENVPIIVNTLGKMKDGKGVPTSMLYMLYTSLAETEVRCCSYLHDVLMDVGMSNVDNLKWEQDIAKAAAIRTVCEKRLGPSSFGKELVPVISSLLSRCGDAAGAPASALCLDSLALLWRARDLAPPSTWAALKPILSQETRPAVQIAACKLLGCAPALRVGGAEFEALLREALRHLWALLDNCGHADVAQAACDALANYRLDDFSLKDIPEIFRKHVKLPPSFCKTPEDAARKPEDVLDYVPCEVWPALYKFTNRFALPGVIRLATRLIEREVRAYRSGVYALETRFEPESLSSLPASSVLRGIFDCFKKQTISPSHEFSEPAMLSLLHTVMAEYPRPLPPVDLCFLAEACQRGKEWRRCCVTLAARQAHVALSAKRLLDTYLQALNKESDELDVEIFFEILPIVCKTMPPNSIRSPIEECLRLSFAAIANVKAKEDESDSENETKEEEYLFIRQLERIRVCLENEKITEANRTLLSQIVESYFASIDDDNIAWRTFVQTSCQLSSSDLERMTSPASWWEVKGHQLRKACAIRCAMAERRDGSNALNWLNDIIDAMSGQYSEHEFSLSCMLPALKAADPDAAGTREWLLQLMGRIQHYYKQASSSLGSKRYMMEVFTLSVLVFSGLHALEPDPEKLCYDRRRSLTLLPSAVATLASNLAWQDCTLQLLEWLAHSRDWAEQEELHALAAQRALLAMRHVPTFAARSHWTKLESHFQRDVGEEISHMVQDSP